MPSGRQIWVVDCESTGLGPSAVILEIAAVNLTTNEELYFVPRVTQMELAAAEPMALKINRYYERGVFSSQLDADKTAESYHELWRVLKDNTFAGSNPTFDSRLLAEVSRTDSKEYVSFGMRPFRWKFGQPHHHRLLDLSAYAAGVLGLPPNELPGLHKVCELLGVTNEGEHSALGDARATAECFRRLMNR